MELKDIQAKVKSVFIALNDLNSALSVISDTVSKELQKADQAKMEQSSTSAAIQKDWASHGAMKTESFNAMQKEKDALNKEKADLIVQKSILDQKMSQAEQFLASAKNKEELWNQKNQDIDKMKLEIEDKLNKINTFKQNF